MQDRTFYTEYDYGGTDRFAPTREGAVNQQTNRNLRAIRQPFARPMIGAAETPETKRNQAALMALRERVKSARRPPMIAPEGAPDLRVPGPVNRTKVLLAEADLMDEEERQALEQTASDMQRERLKEVGTSPSVNPYTGTRSDGKLQPHDQIAATSMAASLAQKKPTYFGGSAQPLDPRLSTQGRNEYGRMAQNALAQHTRQTQQARAQTEGDQQRLAERQRLATEGDAWLADQQQKSQALLALGTRNARAY